MLSTYFGYANWVNIQKNSRQSDITHDKFGATKLGKLSICNTVSLGFSVTHDWPLNFCDMGRDHKEKKATIHHYYNWEVLTVSTITFKMILSKKINILLLLMIEYHHLQNTLSINFVILS